MKEESEFTKRHEQVEEGDDESPKAYIKVRRGSEEESDNEMRSGSEVIVILQWRSRRESPSDALASCSAISSPPRGLESHITCASPRQTCHWQVCSRRPLGFDSL